MIPILIAIFYLSRYLKNQLTLSSKSDGKNIYTPIYELVRKSDNKKVIFYGCIHVGNETYYEILQSRLNAQEGIVMYEGNPKSSTVNKTKEKAFWTKFSEVIGGISQNNGITYSDEWISNDIMPNKLNKLAKMVLNTKLLDNFLNQYHDSSQATQLSISWLFSTFLLNRSLIYIMKIVAFILYFPFNLFNKRKVVSKLRERVKRHWTINVRNEYAIKKLDEYLPDHNVIGLLWGAAHYKGMKKHLLKLGFIQIHEEWLTAFTQVPHLPNTTEEIDIENAQDSWAFFYISWQVNNLLKIVRQELYFGFKIK